jgi:hypothetical protein
MKILLRNLILIVILPACVAPTPPVDAPASGIARPAVAVPATLTSTGPTATPTASTTVAPPSATPPGVPAGWRPYGDPGLGFSLAYPEAWEMTQNTDRSRLFDLKRTEPGGPSFPKFYVTVLPAGFTCDGGSAYNCLPSEDLRALTALPIGQSLALNPQQIRVEDMDGDRVVLGKGSGEGERKRFDLWLLDLSSGAETRLTQDGRSGWARSAGRRAAWIEGSEERYVMP